MVQATTEIVPDNSDKLKEFFEFIYGDQIGYSYSPVRDPKIEGDWSQYFFLWPQDRDLLVKHCLSMSPTHEVYYSPALYKEPNATKESLKTCQVVWAEFDGRLPDESSREGLLGSPSTRIQSSTDGHEHWYWKLDTQLGEASAVEKITGRITYALGADFCWNSNRVLRPPFTTHHESGRTTRFIHQTTNHSYSLADFGAIPELPEALASFSLGIIPDALDVVAKYKWPQESWDFFKKKEQLIGSRSSALTRLSLNCAEMNMSNSEIYAILLNADKRWKKFYKRTDQQERLVSLIKYTRAKQLQDNPKGTTGLQIFSFKDFFEANIVVEWIIPDILPKMGSAIIAGAPGVGKTQVTLQTAIHMALGKKFTDWKIVSPQKSVIFSLEMNHRNLRVFLDLMKKDLTKDEQELLHENLHIIPIGESLNFDKPDHQNLINEVMTKIKPNGIFVDSFGQAMTGNLSSKEDIDRIFGYVNSSVKNRYEAFCWFVHFPRKPQVGNKKPKTLDDLYGNTYIGGNIDLGLLLWATGDEIELSVLKNRLGEKPLPKFLRRTKNLNFEISRVKTSKNGKSATVEVNEDNDMFNF